MSRKNLIKMAERLNDLSIRNPGVITPFEARVLQLYIKYDASRIAEIMGCKINSVYGVFSRIKKRRKTAQKVINTFNNLCKHKQFYHVLTPKPEPPEEDE